MRRSAIPVLGLAAALLGPAAFSGAPLAVAQEATPAAACPDATPEGNEAVVTRFLEAVHAGGDAAVAELTTDSITYRTHGAGERPGDAEGFLRGQRASFPDADMTIDLLVADGDTVAAYVSWSGTLAGETVMVAGREASVPEGQRDAAWVGALFFRLECGKIAEVWPVIDRLGHLRDLGVITDEDLQRADAAGTPAP